MGRVFLSYAREDLRRARKVARALEAAGHEVWWDSRLKGGSEYSREIDDALKSADAVVVLWSAASVSSEWVRDEATVGKHNGRLVPASIDGAEPPLGFRQHHTIDLAGRNRAGIGQLLETIADRVPKGREGAVRPSPSTAVVSRRRWIILGAAAAFVLALAFALVGLSGWPTAERKVSLAVLPFADLSPARDKAYFAEGVAEEILSTLAAEPGIKVLGRTSARMVERGADPRRLRKQLGVTHLLEGSARSAGDQLRVNVRLIDTADGSQIWQEEYQGRLADVFVVQDQIAATVLKRLRGTLFEGGVRAAKLTSVDAYQLYLAARTVMRDRSEKSLGEALRVGEQVLAADPDYAPGHAMVAEIYYLLSDSRYSAGSMPIQEARARGIPHARRAIALSPELADGYGVLGLLLPRPAQSLGPLRKAVRLDPSRADLKVWLGRDLEIAGLHDEAVKLFKEAVEIEPLWPMPINRLTLALSASGRQDEALAVARKYRDRGGSNAQVLRFLNTIARSRGDLSAAIAYSREAAALQPGLTSERVREAEDLYLLGFRREASTIGSERGRHIAARLYASNNPIAEVRAAGPQLWYKPDADAGFFLLGRERDWTTLARLHRFRPAARGEKCAVEPRVDQAVVLALRAVGQSPEARRLLGCLEQLSAVRWRQMHRWSEHWPGELEFETAGLAAISGNHSKAIQVLISAVDRGWIGQAFSPQLADYPQFDSLRNDPRLASLQRRINRRIAQERAEVMAPR